MVNINGGMVRRDFFSLIIVVSVMFLILYILIDPTRNAALVGVPNSEESRTPIKHIIVISQGKRSFDNYFGTFPGANGIAKNLTVPLNPFPHSLKKFTLAVWFNTSENFSTNAFLVNKGGVGIDTKGYNMNYGIWMNSRGNIIAGFEDEEGMDRTVGSNQKYNDGKWHQAVVTYDGNSNLILFIDGRQVAIKPVGVILPDSGGPKPIRIGANSFQPDNFFRGFVDEVRIWNRTLDSSEILDGYVNNRYNPDKQIVYSSFVKIENYLGNVTDGQAGHQLKGIYLNGSGYVDVNIDMPKNTSYLKPFHLDNTKTDNPVHGANSYDASYNKGQMNGFAFPQLMVGKEPNLVLGYYNATNIPYYWKFATEYVLADNFFASSMDSGLENENYLYTGAKVDNRKNISFRDLDNLNQTIFDQLQNNGISWTIYMENYNSGLNLTDGDLKKNRFAHLLTETPRFLHNMTLNSNFADLVEYFRDLRNDDFPSVAYIVAPNSEESSPRDVSTGQEFVSSLVLALMKSKHWNDSAFFITYRESGGWYDHVTPPKFDGQQYGFRVPALIISPYAKQAYIDSTFYDAASILKFIEYNYNIPPIAKRDANANNIINAFDFTKPPREPLLLRSSYVNSPDENMEKNIKKSESASTIYSIYLTIIPLTAIIGFLLWWKAYRSQKPKLDKEI